MLPRLEAEEAIADANEVAYGTGSLKPEQRRAMARRWQAAAHPRSGGRAPAASPETLATMGIQVVTRRG